jgi:murein DD-endopeptidase MepM/ murein hydrolase activator NlpD
MATLQDEIASLSDDIDHINSSVAGKRQSVGDTLRALQRLSEPTILTALLRGSTLADSVFKANALSQMQNKLRSDITELSDMEKQMSDRVAAKRGFKQEVATKKELLASRKSIIEDQKAERATLLEVTKNKESTYQKQLAELQKQQDKMEAEIAAFEKQLKDKFDTAKLAGLGKGIFSWPIVLTKDGGMGRLTQHFGEVSSLYRGRPHNGMDIGVPVGTPVYAAADGTVMAADNNDQSSWRKYQYGKHVLIKHPDNLATLYGHLSRYVVSVGQSVVKGQIIGYSGNTGYSTGAHLHFGVYWAPSIELKYIPPAAGRVPVGVVLNPEDYL